MVCESKKIVLSTTMKQRNDPHTRIVSENISGEIENIKKSNSGDIVIFGSPSAAHSLMRLGLIDDFWLFVNPFLLGQGIPLFTDPDKKVKLQLNKSHAFSNGVVCLHYSKI